MENTKIKFPLDIQFFAQDENAGGNNAPQNSEPNENGEIRDRKGQGSHIADGQHGEDAHQDKNENFIPKSRFDEVNNKYKELQEQLDNLNKQKEQEELEAKKKKGEFENLYNETAEQLETVKTQHEQASERVTVLEGIIETLVESELEAVPEEMRDLVPENFTPEQKLSWITNAKKKGLFGTATNDKENEELGNPTNNSTQAPTDATKMSIAQMFRHAYGSKK